MSRDRPVIEVMSSSSNEFPLRTRSAVTNHKDLLHGLDGRSATARRFRDLVNAFIADMGGLDHCSEIRLGLLRRLAATTVQAEMLEARMVNGEAIDQITSVGGDKRLRGLFREPYALWAQGRTRRR